MQDEQRQELIESQMAMGEVLLGAGRKEEARLWLSKSIHKPVSVASILSQ